MKKRMFQACIASLMVSVLAVTPVFATSIEDMQEDKSKVQSEAASLQEELTQLLDKINNLETDISEKEKEIEKAGDELEAAAARQTEQYNDMKLRIKYMYENGDSSLIEALLTSDSFSDLMNKAEYVQGVHSYDRKKLEEYVETTKEVEQLKSDLEDDYSQMQTMQESLQMEEDSLNATLEEKQSEIAQLDQSIQNALEERRLAEERAREEAARQEAAAQQAAQEAAQQPSSNNNNNNSSNSSGGNNTSSGGGTTTIVPPQGRDGAAVVAYARQFIGYPYVFGGNSLTGGIDCSGFTQQIYAAFGVSLPRTSYDQENCGYEIPLSQAQAGDLLCYDGHVGIYNGTGGIVHASSPSVGITEFSNCQYRALRCVRRVL